MYHLSVTGLRRTARYPTALYSVITNRYEYNTSKLI